MSTFRAKHIRRSPDHRLRFIFLDPAATSCRLRTRGRFRLAQTYLRSLPATEAWLVMLFFAGSSVCVAAQIGSSQSQTEQSAEAAVKSAYKAYLRALKDSDYTALNNFLSDGYQAVNFQGIVSTKVNEIATAKQDRTYNTFERRCHLSRVVWRLCHCFRADRGGLEGRTRNPADDNFAFSCSAAEAEGRLEARSHAVDKIQQTRGVREEVSTRMTKKSQSGDSCSQKFLGALR